MTDMWDPNTWDTSEPEYRIWDEHLEHYALVDLIDYQWATQWAWSKLWSRGNKKFYLRRAVTVILGKDDRCEHTGRRIQNRMTQNLFLHVAIMDRMGLVKPSKRHYAGHVDDNGLNCKRDNLAYITPSQNTRMTIASGRHKGFQPGNTYGPNHPNNLKRMS